MLVPVPADLPSANPTKSYWQTPPSSIADHRSTSSLPITASYVIVGSGITGASIAHKLLEREPSAHVVLLEARRACSGATGRNGGHCKVGRYLTFARDAKLYGEEEAVKLSRWEEQNVRDTRRFVKSNNIDCDMEAVETVDIFWESSAWEDAVRAVTARRDALADDIKNGLQDRTLYTAEETKERFKTPSAVGAITFSAWTLHPYKLVCGILGSAIRKGLNFQTNTPVLSVTAQLHATPGSAEKRKWIVKTERGQIVTGHVILATNAYTSHLYPALGKFIIPTRAQIAAQRPGSAVPQGDPVLARSYGFFTPGGLGDYMLSRPRGSSGEGDVIMGGGRVLAEGHEQPVTDDSAIHPVISKYLKQAPTELFGQENWGDPGEFVAEWTGIMGVTVDGEPILGEVPGKKGLWICAGFNGHGMALAFQSTEAIVRMVLGEDEEQLSSWLPQAFRLSRFVPGKRERERASENESTRIEHDMI